MDKGIIVTLSMIKSISPPPPRLPKRKIFLLIPLNRHNHFCFLGHIKENLNKAIKVLEQKTCLEFVPYNGQKNYIYFANDKGYKTKKNYILRSVCS